MHPFAVTGLPGWQIGECSPDMEGTGEIKYPGADQNQYRFLAVDRAICKG
jgi:hypothetical protein